MGIGAIVMPRAVIHAGCTLGDRAVVQAGAVLEQGVVVESTGMVGAGSVVKSNTIVKAGELWAGNPAVSVRALGEEELNAYRAAGPSISKVASIHAEEASKDLFAIHLARREFKDRDLWSANIAADQGDAKWGPFYNAPTAINYNPQRRGLVYDKQ